jgi:ATP-binding cassette subfamily C protein CydC
MTPHDTPPPGSTPIRHFLRTIGGHRRWVLATATISAAAAGSGIGLIAFAAVLISRSALLSSTASLALIIVAVRFFATTRVVLRYVERMVGHLGTFRLLTKIRTWFFDSVTPIAPRGLTDRRTGELLSSILTDVDTMQDLYLRVLIPPVVAVLTVLVAATVIAVSDAGAALILLIVFVGGTTAVVVGRRGSHRHGTTISESRSLSSALIIDSVDAARELAMFSACPSVLVESSALDATANRARLRLAIAQGRSEAMVAIASASASIAVLMIAITAVRSGSLPGELLAMFPLVALLSAEALSVVAPTLDALDRSRSAARRLLGFADRADVARRAELNLTPVTPETPGVTDSGQSDPSQFPALDLRDLTMITESGRCILDHVSFTLAHGEVLAVVGESGSGKSTLIDLLLGFDTFRGELAINGFDVGSRSSDYSRRQFSAVRQHDHVFDTTIRDNLALADADATDARLLEVLEVAGFGDALGELPEGLNTRTGPNGQWLSGGERQRLIIARSVLAERPILLLDEAFEHLDAVSRERAMTSVLAHRTGRTTVLVTHDPATIERATHILELRDGHVVTDDEPRDQLRTRER